MYKFNNEFLLEVSITIYKIAKFIVTILEVDMF